MNIQWVLYIHWSTTIESAYWIGYPLVPAVCPALDELAPPAARLPWASPKQRMCGERTSGKSQFRRDAPGFRKVHQQGTKYNAVLVALRKHQGEPFVFL